MKRAIIMRGLQGSGKSTKAKEIAEKGFRILSLDTFREQMPQLKEKKIVELYLGALDKYASLGEDLVLDNTHISFAPGTIYNKTIDILSKYKYTYQLKDMFDISKYYNLKNYLDKSIRNNSGRYLFNPKKYVPDSAIYEAYMSGYDWNPDGEKIVICDIDGTLANLEHREHFVVGERKDWKNFYANLNKDLLYYDIDKKIKQHKNNGDIVILVSGRPDTYYMETKQWLNKNKVGYDYILMRKGWDSREDSIIKEEIYKKCLEKYKDLIINVYDDRKRVIDMWQSNGLNVINCSKKENNDF